MDNAGIRLTKWTVARGQRSVKDVADFRLSRVHDMQQKSVGSSKTRPEIKYGYAPSQLILEGTLAETEESYFLIISPNGYSDSGGSLIHDQRLRVEWSNGHRLATVCK